jgi:predicted nuclease of predicted toxin-antitoxin system
VRLFLDAHVSARRIATALRAQHDVRAADEERELDGWDDERLLALATEEGRIMVTFNVADFARIATEWPAGSKSHAGCLLIVGIDHREFGLILRVINHALSTRPDQAAWVDYTACGTRSTLADTTTPPTR